MNEIFFNRKYIKINLTDRFFGGTIKSFTTFKSTKKNPKIDSINKLFLILPAVFLLVGKSINVN